MSAVGGVGSSGHHINTSNIDFTTLLFNPNLHDSVGAAPFLLSINVDGSTTNISITPGHVTIGEFADAVGLSLNNSHQQFRAGQSASFLANAKGAINQISANLAFLFTQLQAGSQIGSKEDSFISTANPQIQTMKNAIATFNNGVTGSQPFAGSDQQQINTYNQAISDYNSGLITQAQFNTAANNYNTYIVGRNASITSLQGTYNAAASTYAGQAASGNATITSINGQITAFNTKQSGGSGLPAFGPNMPASAPSAAGSLLPSAQTSPPLTVPIPSSARLTLPSALVDHLTLYSPAPTTTNPTPNQKQFTFNMLVQDFIYLANTINLFNKNRNLHEDNTNFVNFVVTGPKATEVNAFIQHIPQVFFQSGAVLGSGGPIGASLTNVTGNPLFSGILSTGVFNTSQFVLQTNLVNPLVSSVTNYGLNLLTNTGLISALPGMTTVGASYLTAPGGENVFGIASGVAISQTLLELVGSGATQQVVTQLVQEQLQGTTDQATINQVAATLTDQLNFFLLETALLIGSSSLGAPGLVAQVNGNTGTVPQAAVTTPQKPTLQQVLNDPLRSAFAKNQLALQLSQQANISIARAQEIINEVINEVNSGEISSTDAYKTALLAALAKHKINSTIANVLANNAVSLAIGEQQSQQIINANLLDRQKVHAQLVTQLTAEGIAYNQAESDATQAVNNLFDQGYAFNSYEFEQYLQTQLTNQGVSAPQAQEAAVGAVTALNTPVAAPPLEVNNPTAIVSGPDLRRHIYDRTYERTVVTVGPTAARGLAESAATTYAGENTPSVLTAVAAHANRLRDRGISDNYVADTFRSFQAPNIDRSKFVQTVLDPGQALYHSVRTGLMYSGLYEPSNYQKTIDVQV